jgi:hypothetical protein
MRDVVFGLLAIAAGALFCFRGYLAFRLTIPIWGAFVGFSLGAGAVASIGDDGFLQTSLAWIVGLAAALVLALLAYLFYAVAVTIAMGSIGFALGTSLMVALGVGWTWVIVLVGVLLGCLLAFAAIAGDLPMFLLIVLAALAGASAITTAIMLLVGTIDAADFNDARTAREANDGWWWYAIYLGLALVGVIAQSRDAERRRGTMRDAWATRSA